MDRDTKVNLVIIRVCFVLLLGFAVGKLQPFGMGVVPAAACGVALAALVVVLETRIRDLKVNQLLGAVAGLFCGAVLGLILVATFRDHSGGGLFPMVIPLVTGYLGTAVGLSQSDRLHWNSNAGVPALNSVKILDTSVIIDGRIADIADSGFLDGVVVIPQFVLRELQMVADSSDSLKRNRGRRGLDIVQRLQKIPRISVELVSDDVQKVREVDLKLLELAKARKCKVVTNDFNLNKVAHVHGVEVLNINELANALKPVVLPGETMRVFILKEGKEYNQGVAYLDDGTMVVVDNAKRQIAKTVDIVVTSVLQTTAGKMIFGKFDERHQERTLVTAAGALAAESASAAAKELIPPAS
ncbi:MAG: PIN domain-containing protein [Bryobacteraceae bacterium]